MASKSRSKRNPLKIITILVVILGAIILISFFKSNDYKNQGDYLIKNGRVGEAIISYTQAQRIFPFRQDIQNSISGAKLILQSDLDYGKISDIDFAEIQTIPSTNLSLLKKLLPNEVFVPILMYHHIEVNPKPEDPIWASLFVTPEQLDSQLLYFKSNGYNTISLDDLYQSLTSNTLLPKNPIVLTFDDGYKSFYQNAYPLLKKYKMKATEFVITQVETAPAYLSWDEIIEMDKSGLIEFGAHTRHHPNLPDLTENSAIDEIVGSKKDIEEHINKPVKWFAYPYGGYNNSIIDKVQKSGFVGAVSTIYGAGQSKDKLYLEPRIAVDGRFKLIDLIAHISQ